MKTWVLKRQLAGVGFFSLCFILVAAFLFFKLVPAPTCQDNKQNGTEEGVDCGGSCSVSCQEPSPKEPLQLWARFFPTHDNMYDASALIENLNIRSVAQNVRYTFKLYDADHVLLARRDGTTYFYPQSKTAVYEPNLVVLGSNKPAFVDFAVESFQWLPFTEEHPLKLEISKKIYTSDPYPTLTATLVNHAVFEEGELEVVGLLERADGTVYAASRTVVEHLDGGSSREVVFTWPRVTLSDPSSVTLLYRRVWR